MQRKEGLITMTWNEILDTMGYCLNHCDSDEERAMIGWVTEKLAEGDPQRRQTPLPGDLYLEVLAQR